MTREWWTILMQWTIWVIVMTLAMRWLAKSRTSKRPDSAIGTLVHPKSTLITGIIVASFFFGIAIISNTVGKNSTTTIWTTLCFIGFGLMGIPIITDYFFGRHQVTAEGIEYGRMFGQRGTIRWPDVSMVSYSAFMRCFVLKSQSGRKIRISAMLMGLPEFARLVLLNVSHGLIDDHAHLVLRKTEQGQLPNLWG